MTTVMFSAKGSPEPSGGGLGELLHMLVSGFVRGLGWRAGTNLAQCLGSWAIALCVAAVAVWLFLRWKGARR